MRKVQVMLVGLCLVSNVALLFASNGMQVCTPGMGCIKQCHLWQCKGQQGHILKPLGASLDPKQCTLEGDTIVFCK